MWLVTLSDTPVMDNLKFAKIIFITLRLYVMKELTFEKMENLTGGDYCDLIRFWYNGGAGYQGSQEMLNYAMQYCH